jgi:hypothetical protein
VGSRSRKSREFQDEVNEVKAWHTVKKVTSLLESRMTEKTGEALSSTASSLRVIAVIAVIFALQATANTCVFRSASRIEMVIRALLRGQSHAFSQMLVNLSMNLSGLMREARLMKTERAVRISM